MGVVSHAMEEGNNDLVLAGIPDTNRKLICLQFPGTSNSLASPSLSMSWMFRCSQEWKCCYWKIKWYQCCVKGSKVGVNRLYLCHVDWSWIEFCVCVQCGVQCVCVQCGVQCNSPEITRSMVISFSACCEHSHSGLLLLQLLPVSPIGQFPIGQFQWSTVSILWKYIQNWKIAA